jgi:hypothetical protein
MLMEVREIFVLFGESSLLVDLANIKHTAFGLFARALPSGDEFAVLREACEGIELADSITGDAHKCLNVVCLFSFFELAPINNLTPNSTSTSIPTPTPKPLS